MNLTQHVFLHYLGLGKAEHTKLALKWTKKQKNLDIIDCNLGKYYQILIVLGTNISDTTTHQMTVQILTSSCYD